MTGAERIQRIERETRYATMSLLLFGSLHALGLAALFWMSANPWNVRVAIAGIACLVSYLAAWLVWRTAGTFALVLGVVAIVGSLARLAIPLELNASAAVSVTVTVLFAAPLVRALLVVSRS
ncbi:MAG: hypothetical protein IPG50_26165 [Myxococcales bacterium]|nr:hypothetical protein [Myxococcales bacterium]